MAFSWEAKDVAVVVLGVVVVEEVLAGAVVLR